MNTPLNVRLAREREEAARKNPVANESFQRKLNEHIAMEQWEKRLLPLFLFKGTKPYRIRALWNIAYGMYLKEVDSLWHGAQVIGAGDVGHLCGVHRVPQNMRSIFDRLRMSPDVTNGVSKAFTEYVEWVHPKYFRLDRVPLQDRNFQEGVTAWWRVPAPKAVKAWRAIPEKVADHAYPYMLRAPTAEHQLLLNVHAMLPKGLPHDIRGDLCQDLVVAVLSGETSVENIPDVVAKYAREARKFLPDRWRHVSLDDLIPGTDDMRYIDRLAAPEQEEECDEHGFGCDCAG